MYGSGSSNTAAGCLQLAVILMKGHALEEAEQLAMRALQINDVQLGKTHETTLQNLTLLRCGTQHFMYSRSS